LAHYNVLKEAIEEIDGNAFNPSDFVSREDGKGFLLSASRYIFNRSRLVTVG